MPFNKTHVKKIGISFLSYGIACLLYTAGFILVAQKLSKIPQGISFDFGLLFIGTVIGFVIGLPFALIGFWFYISGKINPKAQARKLFWIAGVIGLVTFFGSFLLLLWDKNADVAVYAIGAVFCTFVTVTMIQFFDRKWI